MEAKSRYEVISELEQKKRELIKERDGFSDILDNKSKAIVMMERQQSDNNVVMDRNITDLKEELVKFNISIDERKETITELITSMNDSLERFGKLSKDRS